jgi:hypothetical protein
MDRTVEVGVVLGLGSIPRKGMSLTGGARSSAAGGAGVDTLSGLKRYWAGAASAAGPIWSP